MSKVTDRTFEQVWFDILDFAKRKRIIKTLVLEEENEIVSVNNVGVIVKSRGKKGETQKERVLRKCDFQYVWDCLESKKIIGLKDIEPKLIGKRSIIFTFLAKALPYVGWNKTGTNPMTIYLKGKC